MMPAISFELPPVVRALMQQLRLVGFSAYIVGGCVRDMLLGRQVVDWDMTTNAHPNQIKEVFSGCKTVDIGMRHGTVGVVKEGAVYEITTFRTDGAYTDSRHPDSVTFTPSLEEDLKRRDFTVNAMAYSEEEGLVDLFSGIKDLQDRVIRTVGHPHERFAEDALRILRGVRFASTLGFSIEAQTHAAMRKGAPALAAVSAERKREEISKLLCGGNASAVVAQESALLIQAWQGLQESTVQQNAPCLDSTENKLTHRLAALLDGQAPACVLPWLLSLRFDKKTAAATADLLAAKAQMPCQSPPAFRRLLGQYGIDACLGAADVLYAQKAPFAAAHKSTFASLAEAGACVKVSQLALDGRDLLPYVKGREVGRVLEGLLEAVISEKTENTRDALLSYAQKYLL